MHCLQTKTDAAVRTNEKITDLRDIVNVNHPIKFDIKIISTLEIDIAKLFESNQQVANIGVPDAQIIWHDAFFIHYEQFRMNRNFRQYLKTSIMTKKMF